MTSHDQAEAGFSLLETLIALAILTMTLTAAYGVWNQSFRSIRAAEERLQLLLLAQMKLEEVSSATPLKAARFSGEGSGGSWEAVVVPGPQGLWRVEVTAQKNGRDVTLRTLKLTMR
jgi:prepilin-type N-terminal cleavage/methylation domain-containing protein